MMAAEPTKIKPIALISLNKCFWPSVPSPIVTI